MNQALHPQKKSTNGRKRSARGITALRHGLAVANAVSPKLAATLARRVFLTPGRHPRPERERELLARAIPLVGIEGLAAWQWGEGPVVLLVHGWEGRGAQLGAFVDPLVAAGFRVVAFDAVAHGASPGSQATLLDFARSVERVAAWVGPLHGVIAHSFGCAGVTLALDRGLTVGAAVFVAPPVRVVDGAQQFAQVLGLSDEVTETMLEQILAQVGLTRDDIDATLLARRRTTPLLVLHDHDDHEVPWSAGAELARAWPRATLLSTRGLGHRRILRDEGVVSMAVQLVDALAPDPGRASDLDRELDALLHDRAVRLPPKRTRAAPVLGGAARAVAAGAS